MNHSQSFTHSEVSKSKTPGLIAVIGDLVWGEAVVRFIYLTNLMLHSNKEGDDSFHSLITSLVK